MKLFFSDRTVVLFQQHICSAFTWRCLSVAVAVSCPDVLAPRDGQVRRKDDGTAIVTCLNSDDVWYLTCKGVTWVGTYGNCSHGEFVLI